MAYGKPVFVSCRTVLVAPCVRNVASGLLIIAGGRIIALLGGDAGWVVMPISGQWSECMQCRRPAAHAYLQSPLQASSKACISCVLERDQIIEHTVALGS